jgi:benzodiazapine receptor
MTRSRQVIGLVGWVLACYAAAGIGALASVEASTFYASLTLPAWAPPAWLFGPVWTVLYGMMALAAWLVWRKGGWELHRAVLIVFVIQLVVNALWSWLFFALKQGALAFADILVLWILVAVTLTGFWKINRLAGALIVPYLLWISFAAALNFAVWQSNPSTLGG